MGLLTTQTGSILAGTVLLAASFGARFKGLMGQREMSHDTALLIKPCNQVHMFFMRFELGIIFLDCDNQVLAKQRLKPWQVSMKVPEATQVIETCPAVLAKVKEGDFLRIQCF